MSIRTRWRGASLIACLAFVATAAHAQTNKRPMTYDDVMEIKRVGGGVISPDGRSVVYTVSGWEHPNAKGNDKGETHEQRSHVWLVSTDGGTPRQISFGERGESNPQFSPDGKYISFTAARGTGTGESAPRNQIWLMQADGGEAWKLTDAKEGVGAYAWSLDGRKIAYTMADSVSKDDEAKRRRRDDAKVFEEIVQHTHTWVIDVATRDAREVNHGAYNAQGLSWSPDGTKLAFNTSSGLTRDERRQAFVVTIATGALERINTPHTPQGAPTFSPDGRTLALATLEETWKPNADSIFPRSIKNSHLVLYDLATKQTKDVSDPSFDYSIGAVQWSRDGKRLYFTTSDRVYSSLFYYDLAAGKYNRVTDGKIVGGLSWSKDGSRVVFSVTTPMEPAELYVSDATLSSPRRLTNTNPQLANIALGETEVVKWKSTDGWEVEGVLIKPVGYQPGTRVPLVVDIHGGPTGNHNAGFKGSPGPNQVYAGRGWALLYPNPRGSTGYGEKFMRGNVPDWGGGDYRDIMTGVDELIRRGIVDSTRLAVGGWSYGGYMTAWVVSQTKRFKAAMMGAGLSNLYSMYGTTDIPGYIATFFNGGMLDKDRQKLYLERSAISYVDQVTTPLLILHGANDERVPIGQPMEYYRQLRDRGKTVQLVFYPREGHGLAEYYHQLDRMKREYDWLAKYTLGRATAMVP